MKVFLVISFLFILTGVRGQTNCSAPGQNPWSAFPVCGTGTLAQISVPICGGRPLPGPCDGVSDVNPYWYKFTCSQTGTLGFRIQPNSSVEDYDWQLYDVTGRDPRDVYTDASLIVSCNWSGSGGTTGASTLGRTDFVCGGVGMALWSRMPQIFQGHNYLLLVSHFSQTQSGYSLGFVGGTAIINDTTRPHLVSVDPSCGGLTLRVAISKKMKCSSIAPDGSDFSIAPAASPVISARGLGCAIGFDADTIELTLASVPPAGNYTLHVQNGIDNNTLLDYCDNNLALNETAGFPLQPLAPTPMDSLSPVGCKPQSLTLVFRKPVLCSSVAQDGSDFVINGSYPVSITNAVGQCIGTTTSKQVIVTLSKPLYDAGNFTITLRRGNDGNTLLDECTEETAAGSSIDFSVKDTVNANFTYIKRYGCGKDTVRYFYSGGGSTNWSWQLDEGQAASGPSAVGLYRSLGNKQVQLAVSNGFCTDTSRQTIALDNFLKAGFDVRETDICPNEPAQFTSQAQGIALTHNWSFGDGGGSADVSPAHVYAPPTATTSYQVTYRVTDSIGCSATAQKAIHVYSSCYLDVATAFTPNGDGLNDGFGPLNAVKAAELDFRVFNRWGQLVYQTRDWKRQWDGTFHGLPQPTGSYAWILSFTDRDSKKRREMKGIVVLIR